MCRYIKREAPPVFELKCNNEGASAGETKRPYIRALQCAMLACLQKATAKCPYAIFFLLRCGATPQNYGLVLACFSLLCNPSAISLCLVAFHMQSEKQAVSSPQLKLPDNNTFFMLIYSCIVQIL